MSSESSCVRFGRRTMLAATVGAVLAGYAVQSSALDWQFDNGGALYWNTTISAGTSFRAQNPSRELYGIGDGYLLGKDGGRTGLGGTNTDSANLNYWAGDQFSTPFKILTDLEYQKDGWGALVRVKAWYDMALEDGEVAFGHQGNDYNGRRGGLDSQTLVPGTFNPCPGAYTLGAGNRPICAPGTWPRKSMDDSGYEDLQKFSGVYLLDAYVYGSMHVGDSDLQLRLGNQVVNWGESVFIQGINQISPIDVASLRKPGTEIKEVLLPVWMAYMNWGFGFGSFEAFYQFKWDNTPIDSCGAYWAPAESLISAKVAGCGSVTTLGLSNGNPINGAEGLYFPQIKGREASDSGQFGVAFRFPVSAIDTEIGLYAMNIHSRLPIVSALSGTRPDAAIPLPGAPFPLYNPAANGGLGGWYAGLTAAGPSYAFITPASLHQTLAAVSGVSINSARGFWEYPEDMQIYGLSAATNLFGWSVSSELSYQKDIPVQRNGNDLLVASLQGLGPLGAEGRASALKGDGNYVRGYDLFDKTQFQVNTVKTYSNILGAQNMLLIGEIGFQWNNVPDHKKANIRYGRSFIYGTAGSPDLAAQLGGVSPIAQQLCTVPSPALAALLNPQPDGCKNDGFVTDFAWGYRLRASLDYLNFAGTGVTLTPSVFWAHDVDGFSMDPQFLEDRQTLGLGLKFNYNKRYTVDLNYSWFADSAFNALMDHDFYGISASVTF